MTPLELRIAREHLGLTVSEAAEHIGGVTTRSWNYFENGERSIKPDIEQKILCLLERRKEILSEFTKTDAAQIAVIYYGTPDHCDSVLEWRFSQSLARTLFHDHGARIVVFSDDYFKWLNGREDSKQMRARWSAQSHQSHAP